MPKRVVKTVKYNYKRVTTTLNGRVTSIQHYTPEGDEIICMHQDEGYVYSERYNKCLPYDLIIHNNEWFGEIKY